MKITKLRVRPDTDRENLQHYAEFFQRIFPRVQRQPDKQVLVELDTLTPTAIAFAYSTNAASQIHGARIVPFIPEYGRAQWLPRTLIKLIRELVWPPNRGILRIYRSFGAEGLIVPLPSLLKRLALLREARNIIVGTRSKQEFESLARQGIPIGDLVYDQFLRRYLQPTINFGDRRLVGVLAEALSIFDFWDNYFKKHEVIGVQVTHSVYVRGIISRVARLHGVDSFEVGPQNIYRINEKYQFPRSDSRLFPVAAAGLESSTRKAGMKIAANELRLRFHGKAGHDNRLSDVTAFGSKERVPDIGKKSRFRVLVAAHSFSDSPHVWGPSLFPDFWEWISFLGAVSQETDYEWFLKGHPEHFESDHKLLKEISETYSNLKLLSANITHNSLLDHGIDAVLTVHGSVGFEYSLAGKTVLTCSPSSPFVGYTFTKNSLTIDQYRNDIISLPKWNREHQEQINKNEVLEYFLFQEKILGGDFVFDNYPEIVSRLGGRTNLTDFRFFEEFQKAWTEKNHYDRLDFLADFLRGSRHRLGSRSFCRRYGHSPDSIWP